MAAAIYYLLALVAALSWKWRVPASPQQPGISILKPVHGRDPHFYEAIRSHASQEYPAFEILFGVRESDPALEDIRRLMSEFPACPIRVIHERQAAANGKVGVLAALAQHARHPVLLINDSDIWAPPDYLRQVAAPLEDPRVGLVTCLYRAAGASLPGRWEALGVATEFAPGVMVARLIGVAEFALGSTMALRAADLAKAGGFEALADYLADDYQLGRRITALGYRVVFAPPVVETHLGAESWAGAWQHQLRWSRTIRVSRRMGYYGYAVTHATLWSLAAMAAGAWRIGLAALVIRMAAGVASARVLGDGDSVRRFWLMPARDLWGFAVWLGGIFGRTVEWRGQKLRLDREGRILLR